MKIRSRFTLRALMDQEDVSLGRLALAAQVHRSFISHLVAGRSTSCRPEVAERIAAALVVPVDILFSNGSSDPTPRVAVTAALDGMIRTGSEHLRFVTRNDSHSLDSGAQTVRLP